MMKPECKDIINVVLPAVRVSVAESLRGKYGYKQKMTAAKLGIVQVAVSKYLHGKYSKEISEVKKYIVSRKMENEIVEKIAHGGSGKEIDKAIDNLCDKLVAYNFA